MTRQSLLLALLLLLPAPELMAQGTATQRSGFDSFVQLVARRDTFGLKKQLRAAVDSGKAAEKRRVHAENMRLGARARIEAKKVEVVRIKDRIGVAKKENREADRLGLEAERKAAELEIKLLERREDLRQAEIELEAKRAELAQFTQKALGLELQLATRRAGKGRKPLGRAGEASLERVIGELEKQTLEAQRAQASFSIDVAEYEIRVIDRALELQDAQQRVLGGD